MQNTQPKFVVLHGGLGAFLEGDVVTADELFPPPPRQNEVKAAYREHYAEVERANVHAHSVHAELARHLAIGSIREAAPHEAQLKKVTIPRKARQQLSYEEMLARHQIGETQLRQELAAALGKVTYLENQERQRVTMPPATHEAAGVALLAEKDEIIRSRDAMIAQQSQSITSLNDRIAALEAMMAEKSRPTKGK